MGNVNFINTEEQDRAGAHVASGGGRSIPIFIFYYYYYFEDREKRQKYFQNVNTIKEIATP